MNNVELKVTFNLEGKTEVLFFEIVATGLTISEIDAKCNKLVNKRFKIGQVISTNWWFLIISP